jgi:hypothetical protein
MRTEARLAAVGAASCMAAALWPLSPALSPSDVLKSRLYAAGASVIVCAAMVLVRNARRTFWLPVAIVSLAAALAAVLAHVDANASCIADYDNGWIVIGRRFNETGLVYVRNNPGESLADLALAVGGQPERLWTSQSIWWCRFWLGEGGMAAIPLVGAGLCALIARSRYRFAIGQSRPPVVAARAPGQAPVYDAFLSYRHTEPDKTRAIELLDELESRGLRVAIDFREFVPNEHFLAEMERCIKQSRFVLCVVTEQYLASDHCSEEAVISKTLDMAERSKRLVPLIFDRVELPIWLHGLVGIDFTESATVDPAERLVALVRSGRR